MKTLRELSGNVTIKNRLVSFLYDIMREKITPGYIEDALQNSLNVEITYINGWLAKYAEYVADSLTADSSNKFESEGKIPEGKYGIWCDPIKNDGRHSGWFPHFVPTNYQNAIKEADRLNRLNDQWNYYAKPIDK